MRLHIIFIVFASLLLNLSARADELVELPVPDKNYRILADYHQGEADKATIVLLHGFLQTRDFSTVKQIGDNLASEGYTVLRPSLSLGIDRRKSSLRCTSIHTHSMEDGTQELSLWMNWLKAKGHDNVVGIGHSFGSLRLIIYQNQTDVPKFKHLILTSLVYSGQSLTEGNLSLHTAKAQKALAEKQMMPAVYQLSFCDKYTSLPDAFLSYTHWDALNTAAALNQISVPTTIIIGSEDNRIRAEWVKQLKTDLVSIQTIEGANHFFDSEHEFDIQEKIQDSLAKFGF